MDHPLPEIKIHNPPSRLIMPESFELKYMRIIWDAMSKYKDLEGDELFSYDDLTESLRSSDLAGRFDFEEYDRENERRIKFGGIGNSNLRSKGLKVIRSQSRYDFPVVSSAVMWFPWFERKIAKGKRKTFLPELNMPGYYTNIRTLPQLLAALRESFPKIDEIQEEATQIEAEILRKKRIKDIIAGSIPDLLKSTFKGTGFQYNYIVGRDFIELNVRLPRKMKAQYNIKFSKVEEGMAQVIGMVKSLRDIIRQFGYVKLSGYGNDEKWINPE